jgi:hypothetical protein
MKRNGEVAMHQKQRQQQQQQHRQHKVRSPSSAGAVASPAG